MNEDKSIDWKAAFLDGVELVINADQTFILTVRCAPIIWFESHDVGPLVLAFYLGEEEGRGDKLVSLRANLPRAPASNC